MAHSAATIAEAERLYLSEGLAIQQICERLGGAVSERTLWDWAAKYEWQRKRAAQLRRESELDAYYKRVSLAMARAVIDDHGEVLDFDPQQIYALAKVAATLKPAAAVQIRKLEKDEAAAAGMSAEDRLGAVLELLEGYGITARK